MHPRFTIESLPKEAERARDLLGAPNNPLLFPSHFLKTTLPKIGGHILVVQQDGEPAAYAFLFPRGLKDGRQAFTVRWHPVSEISEEQGLALIARRFPDADLTGYDPRVPQSYEQTEILIDDNGFRYGRPDETEAIAARGLQRRIWIPETDDDLYPADLYSSSFGAATSLVARKDGNVIGFLFGFYKFGGLPLPRAWEPYEGTLRIESQVAGVDKNHQRKSIGFHLKKLQAGQALRKGASIINWTVDPLQFSNANLNFRKLRAVSFRFLPGHYALKSDQNRTRASRLEISWLLPVAKDASPGETLDLDTMPEVVIVNDGPRAIAFDPEAEGIAVEIPRDWTGLQKENLSEAERWRDGTDEILGRLLGPEEGRYTITDVGKKEDRVYLVGRRS